MKEFPYVLIAELGVRSDVQTTGFKFIEGVIPLNRLIRVRGLATDETGELRVRRLPGETPALLVRMAS